MKTFLHYLLIASMLAVALPAAAEVDTASMLAQISKTLSLLQEEVTRLKATVGNQPVASAGALGIPIPSDTAAPLFAMRMMRGMVDGIFVPRLQACLRGLGYLELDAFTDVLGPKTEAGVVAFQRSENIISSGGRELGQGVVGPITRERLNTICPPILIASATAPAPSPSPIPYYNKPFKTTLTVSKDPSVPSQNILINFPNQPLGGFLAEVTGEPVVVGETVFRLSQWAGSGGTGSNQDVTEITLQRSDGTILAGPVSIDASSPTITFPTRVVYPIGTTNVILKGKLGIDYATNDTLVSSTTPSIDWKNAVGQRSGRIVIPAPSSPVTDSIMTAKGPALSISVAPYPPEQTVKAPQTQFIFANYFFDAVQSGENLMIFEWPFEYNVAAGDPTNLKKCKLYNGNTVLTTGSNVVNPTGAASSTVFVLDKPFIISKATVEILTLKCDIIAGASGKYAWGYDESSTPSATGQSSGQPAVITEYDNMGQIMTVIP